MNACRKEGRTEKYYCISENIWDAHTAMTTIVPFISCPSDFDHYCGDGYYIYLARTEILGRRRLHQHFFLLLYSPDSPASFHTTDTKTNYHKCSLSPSLQSQVEQNLDN